MHKRFTIIRVILFCLPLIGLLLVINYILEPKYTIENSDWPTTNYIDFYNLEQDSIDVLFLGSSVAANAFNPQELYSKYGITSYNLASAQQSLFMNYYWLKEALRYQSPSVVVVDTKFLWNVHPEDSINMSEGHIRRCLDPMKWSSVKMEAVHELCKLDGSQDEMSYYFKNKRYHSKWTSLSSQDFQMRDDISYPLMGFALNSDYVYGEFSAFDPTDEDAVVEFAPLMQEYLDKISALCKENNISLVLTSMPGGVMNDSFNNTLEKYASDNGIAYYNFAAADLYSEVGAELPRESIIEHANLWGSIKLMDYLGGVFTSEYGLKSHKDLTFEESVSDYESLKYNCEIKHIENQVDYLNAINVDNYAVFITANHDSDILFSDEVKTAFSNLGLRIDMEQYPYHGYVAAIIGGEVVCEQVCAEPYGEKGTVGNKIYSISNSGLNGNGQIQLDGQNLSRTDIGTNIVVYDIRHKVVVDNVVLSGEEVLR
ncbi:hypothetical protein SAMN02910298_02771 [Pseudobutyrivibrio sp. YE44]|uniref:hypothetical protein n=1 Tax=Pseudobutyrivibrio sp. YE44 TaxID=1520802 RepID=UPI00088DE09B|nr:hypothetical protein [Pseudobutyrivibrio sp. YE44]SDB54221.1 hypothetical protein SAMN02910298_02771 [Pseudobutyrivibrio sp. YE44]